MKKALGMIEFKTVASGITATDLMLKTANVEVVQANPVCPGKYLATIAGEISSVKAAIEAVCTKGLMLHLLAEQPVNMAKVVKAV